MVTTDDPTLAKQIARLRVHGMEPKYHHHEVGYNARIDALQAAAGETIALPIYPELTEQALRHVVGTIADFFEADDPAFHRKRNVA